MQLHHPGREESGNYIVIDPGDEIGRIARRLNALGLKLKQILITHAHIDHVGGALKLKKLTGALILMNENDLPQLKIMTEQADWLGVDTPETAPPDGNLSDGLVVGLDRFPAQVTHTPGHTQGLCMPSLCPAQPTHRGRYPLRRKHRPPPTSPAETQTRSSIPSSPA